jgi:ubiquinol-cytochrome c reductase cytochrome c subunit
MIRVLLIASLAASLHAQAQNAGPGGNAQKGKQLFQSYGCYQCHGREAQGEAGTGPRLAPKPIPFAALAKYVRQPTGQMPPYTKRVVSDADLADIYAFLSAQPAPVPAKNIPLLNN